MRALGVVWVLALAACQSGASDSAEADAGSFTGTPVDPDAGAAVDGAVGEGDAQSAERFYVRIGTERWLWSFTATGDGAARRDDVEGAPAPVLALRALPSPPSALAKPGLRCGRVEDAARWIWFCARIEGGVLVGRMGVAAPGAPAPRWTAGYPTAFSGWSATTFEGEGTTRVFEVQLGDGRHARLRIGAATGRLKVWSRDGVGALGEEFERDLVITRERATGGAATGTGAASAPIAESAALRILATPACSGATDGSDFRIEASIDGRRLHGRLTRADGTSTKITGERAEILGQGLESRTDSERAAWQSRTRARLRLLALGGDPAPVAVRVTKLDAGLPPLPHVTYQRARDDDPDAWPPAYSRHELAFEWDVEEPWSGAVLTRRAHAWLMVPEGPSAPPAPLAGRPMLLSLNGHTSSGRRSTNPDDIKYWFAEGFARRGYVVLALDVGHRNLETREGLYNDYVAGDDPTPGGNGLHPAIALPNEPSAWEEMGERAWDAERAAEYMRALPGVDPKRMFVMGHSMGGEVALWAGAVDTQLGAVVSSGFAGDWGVMGANGAHVCFRWLHADAREYLDATDLAALAAPRTLVVMHGKTDPLYSSMKPTHGQAREFFRRAALAWGVDPRGPAPGGLVSSKAFMYLHYDEHYVHTGDRSPTDASIPVGLTFSTRPRPRDACDHGWQTDEGVALDPRTLIDLVGAALP